MRLNSKEEKSPLSHPASLFLRKKRKLLKKEKLSTTKNPILPFLKKKNKRNLLLFTTF